MDTIRIWIKQGEQEFEIECDEVKYQSDKIELIETVFKMLDKYGTN